MGRTRTTEAIVLKNNRVGDIHKGLVMLSPNEGLIRPIAHGAYSQKGKLRGTTSFLCEGTAYLYADPVRDSLKLTDMDVRHFFSGIREELTRLYTASLWAEVILYSFATGDNSGELYRLLIQCLEFLEQADADTAGDVNVQFLWRYLQLSGLEPDLYHCAISGDELVSGEPIYYSRTDEGFCSHGYAQEQMTVWRPGAVSYMRHTARVPLDVALRVTPPAGSISRIKRVTYAVLEEQLERPLKSIESSGGIL